MMKELLKIKNLCKDKILHNISVTIEKGEMVAIMGPSGSGKSTFLYNVAGMDQPTSGEVWLENEEMIRLSEEEKAYIRLSQIGIVFQQMNMMANLNLLDNILLPAIQANKKRKVHNESKKDLELRARKLMKKLSIEELAERDITEVSGGQLQRACICRSLINQPKILLADEPTGALNKSAATQVMEEFVKLNKEEVTILIVTHDSKVASRCDRILYLLDGRIQGEFHLNKLKMGAESQREETVSKWLMKMGW